MKDICILGSINMDIVLKVSSIPLPGETVLSEDLKKIPGGKGANQAVAASRLGGSVHMIGKVGQDDNGSLLLKNLIDDGIDVDNVLVDSDKPTGIAIISVGRDGNNSIIVSPGANMNIEIHEVYQAENVIRDSGIVVAQFETPVDATVEAFKTARKYGVTTLLNPAPARQIPEELMKLTDILVPNEVETFELTGVRVVDIKTAREAADKFIASGIKHVIITLGEKGAALISGQIEDFIPAYRVEAVDTTAAGDAFIGAIAVKLCGEHDVSYYSLRSALIFANKVSAIVVQRHGAQPSLPFIREVAQIYGEV